MKIALPEPDLIYPDESRTEVQVIPVLDLMHGHVVRGIAGKRDEYQPLVSGLVDSSRPLDVARALRDRFGMERFYIADLDAILGEIPHWEALGWLIADGFQLDVDLGVHEPELAERLFRRGISRVILSLESFPDPSLLPQWVQQFGTERLIFSLDLRQGVPLCSTPDWPDSSREIAHLVAQSGIGQLIVLDLAHVGVNSGLGTLPLCRRIAADHPQLQIITGGGIRNCEDLDTLIQEPLAGVLVASALHDGRLTLQDINRVQKPKDDPTVDQPLAT